jgi:membrane protease YdiL (CAAX protease family)
MARPNRLRLPRKIIQALDLRLTAALIVGVLLVTLDYYNHWLPVDSHIELLRLEALESLLFYFVAPLLIIAAFGDSTRDYGLQVGDWRAGLLWALGSTLLALPVLFLAARTPEMIEYYNRGDRPVLEVLLVSGVDLLGWEFFFRGFLLFLLARLVGPNAILLQAVPFALAHLGKPQLETITTIFGGAYFGWIAWRTRSFLYPFLLHWLINAFVYLVASGTIGY